MKFLNHRPQVLMAIVASVMLAAGLALAQGGSKKGKPLTPAQLKSLDSEAERLQQSFLVGMEDLARSYEDAGQIDRAKTVLQGILKIDPGNKAVEAKLKAFEEAVFNANEIDLDVDAAHGWTASNLVVHQGKAVRFAAAGSYKFIVNETLGPDGFSTRDVVQEMSDAPAGALVGLVMPPPAAAGENRQQPKGAGRPFLIGSALEYTPLEDGLLFIKLNIPPSSKCIGKIRVTISGNIQRSN